MNQVRTMRVRVWDAPTRIVHWLLVALIAFSWWSGENGELTWHRYSGYAVLGALVFRVYWAMAGGGTARLFAHLRGPGAVFAYARTLASRTPRAARAPGHNPLGAWSAAILLALLLAQATLGLFAVDVDGVESGPLSHLVSFDAGRACAELHEELFDVLLAFIGLHIAAVLFYLFYRRENLIAPMLTGLSTMHAPESAIGPLRAGRFIAGVLLAVFFVWAVVSGFWL